MAYITVTQTIDAAYDNVSITGSTFNRGAAYCKFGRDGESCSAAFRFHNLDIPKNAIITSTAIVYHGHTSPAHSYVGFYNIRIVGEASSNAAQIVSYEDFIDREQTAASHPTLMHLYFDIEFHDYVTTIVQELVNRSDWNRSSNAINIFFLSYMEEVEGNYWLPYTAVLDSTDCIGLRITYWVNDPLSPAKATYTITTSDIDLIYQPNAAPALPFVSTKGAKWQIGVWHPVPNPHFDKCDRCISKLDSDFLTGDIIALAASYYFSEHLQVGDAVKIGPSSYPGFKGAIEYGLIVQKLVAPERLKFSEPLQAKYKAGDSLIAWGTSIPSGAVHTQAGTKWTSLGTIHKTLDYLFGAPWALGLQHDGSLNMSEIIMSSGQRLLSNTKYFFSVIYKSGVISAQVEVIASGLITLTISTGQNLWTEVSGSGTSQTAPLAISDGYASFYKTASPGSVAGLYIKTVVLMHCADTSQESSGVLTLNAYPDRSTSIKVDSGSKDVKTIDDEIIVFNNSVGNNTKLEINAKFSKVDQTTLNDLQRLEEWQNKGCLLCLNAHLFDIPKWMIGKMEIRDITRDEETKLVSFGFLFEELV